MKFARSVLQFLFISLLIFSSCKKDDKKPEAPLSLDSIKIKNLDPYAYSDSILKKKVLFVYLDDSTKSFNGIFEAESYGIGFFILKPLDTVKIINYQSEFLDGIGDGAEFDTITFLSNQKFLYYNSGSAFIGSRNLEIYQYIFSPETKEVFKSYTALSEDGSVIQTYSSNLKDKSKNELKIFFKNQIQSKYIDDLEERRIKIVYE